MAAVGFMVISLSLLTSFAYHYRQCQLMVMQELQAKQTFYSLDLRCHGE